MKALLCSSYNITTYSSCLLASYTYETFFLSLCNLLCLFICIAHSNKGPVYLKLSRYLLASAWKSLKPSNTDLAIRLLPRKPEYFINGSAVTDMSNCKRKGRILENFFFKSHNFTISFKIFIFILNLIS